jgi:DNA-binding protein H-NS
MPSPSNPELPQQPEVTPEPKKKNFFASLRHLLERNTLDQGEAPSRLPDVIVKKRETEAAALDQRQAARATELKAIRTDAEKADVEPVAASIVEARARVEAAAAAKPVPQAETAPIAATPEAAEADQSRAA